MCDFHSIVVRSDGKIAHIARNSHSGAVEAAGWRENADHRARVFVEAEWSGAGEFPGSDKITRGTPNDRQARVIKNHYESLAKLLADPKAHAKRMLFDRGIFSDDIYADIRWRVLIHPDCPKDVTDRLVTLPLHANGERIKSLDPRIITLVGNLAVEDGYEINAPALTEVGGNLDVSGSAKLDAPALTEVGGYLAVYGSAKLDALTKVGGYLAVSGSAKLDAPLLKRK